MRSNYVTFYSGFNEDCNQVGIKPTLHLRPRRYKQTKAFRACSKRLKQRRQV